MKWTYKQLFKRIDMYLILNIGQNRPRMGTVPPFTTKLTGNAVAPTAYTRRVSKKKTISTSVSQNKTGRCEMKDRTHVFKACSAACKILGGINRPKGVVMALERCAFGGRWGGKASSTVQRSPALLLDEDPR